MNSYFILFLDEQISLYNCLNEDLMLRRVEGEKSQKYHPKKFWKWFKEKEEYEGEPLSFVIISDKKEFTIPDDIIIADKNSFSSTPSCLAKIQRLKNDYNIISIPKINNLDKVVIPKKVKKSEPIKPKIENITKPTIADFYKKETQRYRNDKR